MNCTVKIADEVIFSSDGKWLHPLFELEDFLKEHEYNPAELFLEDKIIGRGAAVLIARLGIRKCHGRLVSRKAFLVTQREGLEISWDTLVDALECQTEIALTDEMTLEESYTELARRAGRL